MIQNTRGQRERFLTARNGRKCANFRGSPLFPNYVQQKNKQSIHLAYVSLMLGCWREDKLDESCWLEGITITDQVSEVWWHRSGEVEFNLTLAWILAGCLTRCKSSSERSTLGQCRWRSLSFPSQPFCRLAGDWLFLPPASSIKLT